MATPLLTRIQPSEKQSLVLEKEFSKSVKIGEEFIWPEEERCCEEAMPELKLPEIDLSSFLSGNRSQARVVDEVCREHGVFVVKNHGVDMSMVEEAFMEIDTFFCTSLVEKQRAQRKKGEHVGYASSFAGRFSTKLPWKETLSLTYCDGDGEEEEEDCVEKYVVHVMGHRFLSFGKLFQKYCRAMSKLCMEMMEVLGESLGVGGRQLREVFRSSESVLRLNYYPKCKAPELALGTGPHSDPTSLTLLYQPRVPGLQVLVDHTWHSVPPTPHAFVVNIGDTLSALTNGVYKPCMHRAVVSERETRKSIAFFLSPGKETVVRAAEEMVAASGGTRLYPDFKWPVFHSFTQKNYRCDMNTLLTFSNWLTHTHNTSSHHQLEEEQDEQVV